MSRDPWKLALTSKRAGQTVTRSGQYGLFTLDGTRYGDGEYTCVRGKTFPPTPERNLVYRLVDATQSADDEGDAPQSPQTSEDAGTHE